MLNALAGFTDAVNQQAFCDKHHLVPATMRQIRDHQNRIFTELNENKTESFANRNRGNFQLLQAVLCAGIFPNVARRRGTGDFLEVAGGKVEARAHGSSCYVPEEPDEFVFFQELSQMESTFKLKMVSPVGHLPMLLMGGEGALTVEQGGGKGGKGGTTISLLDGWLKFRTDPAVADQIQKLRGSLQSAFQMFCQKAADMPPPPTLQMLDKVAALLSGGGELGGSLDDSMGGEDYLSFPQGIKRDASWDAEGQRPQQKGKGGGGKGKKGGGGKDKGGGGKGKKGKGGKW